MGEKDTVISVRDLTKAYRLYKSHADRVRETFHPFRKRYHMRFYALRGVSFDVKKGETLGIVGKNGSGKSTLLQILCGILQPTSGRVKVVGKVSALLELGAGFNGEFTGRQNVYQYGSILGLAREDMDERFHRIAAFADIGDFMDQPVKLYSDGMHMRLAFSIQAFMPKEVLFIDEALAVGDEAFQRKCMALLDGFRDAGGTVLLVSHDTQMIVRQCDRCLLLSDGELVTDDASKPVTDLYHKMMHSDPQGVSEILSDLRQGGLHYALTRSQGDQVVFVQSPGSSRAEASRAGVDRGPEDWFDPDMPKASEIPYGNGGAEIMDCAMINEKNERVNVLVMARRYKWTYRVRFYEDAHHVHFGMMLKTTEGMDLAGINTESESMPFEFIPASTTMDVVFSVKLNVGPGIYFLNAGVMGMVGDKQTYLHRRVDVEMIRVIPCDDRDLRCVSFLEQEVTCSRVS